MKNMRDILQCNLLTTCPSYDEPPQYSRATQQRCFIPSESQPLTVSATAAMRLCYAVLYARCSSVSSASERTHIKHHLSFSPSAYLTQNSLPQSPS